MLAKPWAGPHPDVVTTATAHSNIALVKYWGKRDARLNLPATGSLSMTLDGLTTTTRLTNDERDEVLLAGTPADTNFAAKVTRHLDLVAASVGVQRPPIRVETENNFPTAAGLASSASGFAALTIAAAHHLGADLGIERLSELSRRGSGSAARSLHGGWVEMARGSEADGSDAIAHQIAPQAHWDLRCVVLATAQGAKKTGSTDGMELTAKTSNYYEPWIASVPDDLVAARAAVAGRDFERLAVVAERSCMRMHASGMAADPAVLYWNGATVELIHRVRALRQQGHAAFFTIDAGPHVKVFCTPDAVAAVRELGADLTTEVLVAPCGGPAVIVESS